MRTLAKDELYARLSKESELLALFPPQEKALEVPPKDEAEGVVVLQWYVPERPSCVPVEAEEKRQTVQLAHDLSDLLLQGDTANQDPLLCSMDGIRKRVSLEGLTRDAHGADPYTAAISLLSEIDYEQHDQYAVLMSPAAWTDILVAHDFPERYLLNTEGKIGRARLVVTPYMEDSEILFLRPETVKLSLGDVKLSTSATSPPSDRASLLLKLELEAADAQLARNIR